jgi:hypothetical protein
MKGNDLNGYRCSAANAYIDLSGVHDYIGLIGLNNNSGATTGSHNFQAAQEWIQPQRTETKQDKEKLKQAIIQHSTLQSKFCSPDGNTATYESLNQAYQMLDTLTKQHQVSGSVILLTDGVPCPDVDEQITTIQKELLPRFRDRGWPVDTIGLGEDAPIASASGCSSPGTLSGNFHDFLRSIAYTTGGAFYDDSHGPVPGVNPLNIAPFFAQIFSKYSGKTLHKDIPPTQLNGETQRRNFAVVDGTTELDVLIVRDNPNIQVSLLNPQSQPIGANDAGILVSHDAYNTIYSIPNPVPGPWILSVSGTGRYLMYDFQQTTIGLAFDSVQLQGSNFADPKPLPLGKPITVTAYLTTNDQPLSNSIYTISGYVSYNNKSNDCAQAPGQSPIAFNLSNTGGNYVGTFTIPDSSSAGTYNILLCASSGSAQNVFASRNKAVRIELFPTPYLISPKTRQPTDSAVSTTVTRWPALLSILYSAPMISALSGWPLQDTPAQPETSLDIEMQWKGKPYTDAAVQSPTTINFGEKEVEATVASKGEGKFLVQFKPPSDGQYSIALQTAGTYKDSYGEFGPPTTRIVDVTIKDASPDWITRAYLISFFYLVVFAFLILLILFWMTPSPRGEWVRNPSADSSSRRRFESAHRNPVQWFFQRNILRSSQAGMPPGLLLRFHWGGRIEVRPEDSPKGKNWKTNSHASLAPRQYQRVQQLVYAPGAQAGDEVVDRYIINGRAGHPRPSDRRSTRRANYSKRRR